MTGLRSGRLAQAAGVNPQTLRYYERRGLLAEPERTPGGHRLYPPETVTVLRVIKAAQRLGFTLEEIAHLLRTDRHRQGRAATELQAGVRDRLTEVRAEMADLALIADTLRAALAVGCEDLVTCANIPECPLPFTEPADVRPGPAAGSRRGRPSH